MQSDNKDNQEDIVIRRRKMSHESYEKQYVGDDSNEARLRALEEWKETSDARRARIKSIILRVVVSGFLVGLAGAAAWKFVMGS